MVHFQTRCLQEAEDPSRHGLVRFNMFRGPEVAFGYVMILG